jgi:hypothetical protein
MKLFEIRQSQNKITIKMNVSSYLIFILFWIHINNYGGYYQIYVW